MESTSNMMQTDDGNNSLIRTQGEETANSSFSFLFKDVQGSPNNDMQQTPTKNTAAASSSNDYNMDGSPLSFMRCSAQSNSLVDSFLSPNSKSLFMTPPSTASSNSVTGTTEPSMLIKRSNPNTNARASTTAQLEAFAFSPPTKKPKVPTIQEEPSRSNKEHEQAPQLAFTPKKFSLGTSSGLITPPKNPELLSTPKKTPLVTPSRIPLMESPIRPNMNTPNQSQRPTSNITTAKNPNILITEQESAVDNTERFIAKHRSDLEEMKTVEQQLEGVKKKDSELSKTMEEINGKMTDFTDSLRNLSLRMSLVTNKMLMSQSPLINEKIEQMHLRYAHLLTKNNQ